MGAGLYHRVNSTGFRAVLQGGDLECNAGAGSRVACSSRVAYCAYQQHRQPGGAILTDCSLAVIILPLIADDDPQPVCSTVIQWSSAIKRVNQSIEVCAVTTMLHRGDKITNTVEIAGYLGPFTRQAVTVWAWLLLP
jgi:hypothetical protein